ncbi:hypothetical protein BH24ACT15_BH24ACT15_38320 [soil metagenome]
MTARPRGFAPWSPQPKTQALVADVLDVLDDYADHLPLTLRQVFYRLVGTRGFPKTEKGYDRLCETANRARRAGLIPWDAIRDDGVQLVTHGGYDSPDDWLDMTAANARWYRRSRQAVQPLRVEVWVEAGGMVPQAARVAEDFGVMVMSCGGFDSVTAKHEAAVRIVDDGRPCIVVHVGDHDPSGVSLATAATEDVDAFARGYGHGGIEVVRAAITPVQAERHGLPGAPPKKTDKRGAFTGLTYQAEALEPADLAGYIRAVIEEYTDLNVHQDVIDAERDERDQLVARMREVSL